MSVLNNIEDSLTNMDHYAYLHSTFVEHAVNFSCDIDTHVSPFTFSDPVPNIMIENCPAGFVDWMVEYDYMMRENNLLFFRWKFKALVKKYCLARHIK